MRTINEQKGYELAKGAVSYLANIFIFGFAIVFCYGLLRDAAGWGVDDSDQSGTKRSGLTVYTDYKTGVQYLGDGHGGLVKREPPTN